MRTLADIRTTDWSMRLDALAGDGLGEVVEDFDDVNQCLRIIMTTQPGTDPLRPTFATNVLEFIDKPITFMRPHAVREVTRAITRWEPRVIVTKVSVEFDAAAGVVVINITWKLNVKNAKFAVPQQTVVSLPVR